MHSRVLSVLPFALASLLVAPVAAAAPPLLLPGQATPHLTGDPVVRAREALVARAPQVAGVTLAHRETVPLAGAQGASVVRFDQTHLGVPVAGAGAAVRVDANGAATSFATLRVATGLPSSATPKVARAVAAKGASLRAGVELGEQDGELVFWRSNGGYRLAWAFYAGVVAPPLPYAPFVVVDAEDGVVLSAHDAISHAKQAMVHPFNPKKTPTLEKVTLDLPDGAKTLSNDLVSTRNCIDEKQVKSTSLGLKVHSCTLKQKAEADANGDFLQYTYGDDKDPEDAYAEISMFRHVTRVYASFRDMGMPELATKPIPAIVNLRMPQGFQPLDPAKLSNPDLPLQPVNNAFFSPPNPIFSQVFGLQGAAMWFFQGTSSDFGYDGDVIYHEFGHAMVDRTIGLIGEWHVDAQGATAAPGGMNEGLADYFSSAITGDGDVGEYASKDLGGGTAIRTLDNSDTCLRNISGEVHSDSTFFSGALWAVRKSLPADQQKAYDTALMGGLLSTTVGDVGYEDVAALFIASLKKSSIPAAADALTAEFAKRGQAPVCKRIYEWDGKPLAGADKNLANTFISAGKQSVAGIGSKAPYAPGLFQVHAKTNGAGTMKVTWTEPSLATGGGNPLGMQGTPYKPVLLVKLGAEPIAFTYEGGVASTAGDPIEATKTGKTWGASVEIPAGATEGHVMIVNTGDLDGYIGSITIAFEGMAPSAGGAGGTGGAGGDTGAAGGGAAGAAGTGGVATGGGGAGGSATANAATPMDEEGGGCGCVTVAAKPRTATLALAALLGLAALRRRRKNALPLAPMLVEAALVTLLAQAQAPATRAVACDRVVATRADVWDRARAPAATRFCDLMAQALARIDAEPQRAAEAAEAAEKALPGQAAPLVVRARVAAREGRHAEAVTLFAQAAELDPSSVDGGEALYARATAQRETGEHAAARATYRALVPRSSVLSSASVRARALVDAGLSIGSEGPGAIAEAAAVLQTAVAIAPAELRPLAQAALALALSRAGRVAEAAGIADEAASAGALRLFEGRNAAQVRREDALAMVALLRETRDAPAAIAGWEAFLAIAGQGPWASFARQRIAELRKAPARRAPAAGPAAPAPPAGAKKR